MPVETLLPEVELDRLTEGAVVHYVMPDGECRAATVIRVWRKGDGLAQTNGCANLAVFVDGQNDAMGHNPTEDKMLRWKTSRLYHPVPNVEGWREALKKDTWHWVNEHR